MYSPLVFHMYQCTCIRKISERTIHVRNTCQMNLHRSIEINLTDKRKLPLGTPTNFSLQKSGEVLINYPSTLFESDHLGLLVCALKRSNPLQDTIQCTHKNSKLEGLLHSIENNSFTSSKFAKKAIFPNCQNEMRKWIFLSKLGQMWI